jgi:hypothetical protein
MTSYLIELRTSNVNSCESSSIMALMWTWSVIHSDSSLIIYICIGFSAHCSVSSSILMLAAKYSCCCFWVYHCLKKSILFNLNVNSYLMVLLFFWDIKSFLFSSLFEKACSFWLYCVACSSSEVLKSFRLYLLYDQLYVFFAAFSIYCSECRRSLYWSYSHWIWFWSAFTLFRNSGDM